MSIEGTKAIGIDELVKIEDGKKGAMFSRELVSQLSEEQRIAFVGEVTRARYKHKDAITEVYRNAAHIANPLVMQIVRDNNYPVTKDGIEDFFKLAKEAHNGNVDFKRKIQEKLNNVPEKVIKVLLPFYYEYINDVSKESKEDAIKKLIGISQDRRESILKALDVPAPIEEGENKGALSKKLTEVLSKLTDEQVKKIRMNEAKIGFIGTVAFSFIEQRAQEMENNSNIVQLQTAFRELRNKEPEILNGLMSKLDEANKEFEPTPVESSVLEVADKAFRKIELDLALVVEANKEVEIKLKGTKDNPGIETALVNVCKELKDNIDDDATKEAMEKVRLEFGNVFNKLNVAIGLKGQVITKEDVSKQLKSVVDTTINGKSLVTIAIEQGNKAGVEKIIAAGADLDKVSNKYTRSPLQALKDGFKDFPENLKALFNKPPRSVVEIANISGNQEIVQAVQQAVEIRKETNEKAQKQQATVTSIISTTYSGPVPSDNPLFIKPLPISTPLMLQQKEEREKQRREVDKASSNPIKLSQPEKRGPTTSQRG